MSQTLPILIIFWRRFVDWRFTSLKFLRNCTFFDQIRFATLSSQPASSQPASSSFLMNDYLKGYALCRRPLCVSWDCHLGALVPRLILLESSISAFWKTVLTLQEQPSIHFNIISCFFFSSDAIWGARCFRFLAFWDSIFAPWVVILVSWKHLGRPF